MAIDLADVVDSFDGNANRRWKTASSAQHDDRRIPILWITKTTGLKYDCFSALRTDHEDYIPVMDVNYKCMRDVTNIHLDASCCSPGYEHHWLCPELTKVENHSLNTPVVDFGTVQEPYKTVLDLRDAVLITGDRRAGENVGEDVELALCVFLVTGCDAQQQQPCAVPITGSAAGSASCAFPVTECAADPSTCTAPVMGRGHEQTLDDRTYAMCTVPVTGCGHEKTSDRMLIVWRPAPATGWGCGWTPDETLSLAMVTFAANTNAEYVGNACTENCWTSSGEVSWRKRWTMRVLKSCPLQPTHGTTSTDRVACMTMEGSYEEVTMSSHQKM